MDTPLQSRLVSSRRHWTIPVSREEALTVREKFRAVSWLQPNFLSKPGVSRHLLVRKSEQEVEWVEEDVVKPEELRAKISASRSRSPKKWQRPTDINPHEDAETGGLPEVSPKRQQRLISMTVDWKKATSTGLEDHVLIYQLKSAAQAYEDELTRIE